MESSESEMPLYAFFLFSLAVLFLLVGYCSSDYPPRMMTSAADVTMVASSSDEHDPFGMILIHLAWIAQRLGGTLALVSFSSFIISGWGVVVHI